jgi:Tol biopolymer transport system component
MRPPYADPHRRSLGPRAALVMRVGLAALGSLLAVSVVGSAAGTTAGAEGDWVLLSSNRDGKQRTYSVDVNGQRLTPLFPPGPPRLVPVAVSRDGSKIAYLAGEDAPDIGPLYVSRADGTGLRRAGYVPTAGLEVFSPNGKFLAFTGKRGIWVVGSDGRGLRRLTSKGEEWFDWSPDSKALVFLRVLRKNPWDFGPYGIVVQSLRGKARVVVRTGPHGDDHTFEYQPQWSPSGRWIGYFNHEQNRRRNGLTLVRPNGKQRHRVTKGAGQEESFQWSPDGRWLAYQNSLERSELDFIRPNGARHRISNDANDSLFWSPDGKRLAFSESKALVVARANGRGLRRLRFGRMGGFLGVLAWLPDSRHVAFSGTPGGDPPQIWVVESDGHGLRRLTNEGANEVVGGTRVAPVLPPAPPNPPTERVLDANTVATSTPVEALSADGPRVAFVPRPTLTDCFHVVVWTPGDDLERIGHLPAPCPGQTTTGVTPLVLAGSRAAWVWSGTDGGECVFGLESATLTDPVPRYVTNGTRACKPDAAHLRGDGDLLVFNDEPAHPSWLVRIGVGGTRCGELLCSTLRKGTQAAPADSVSGALIAIRRPGTVTVLDGQGRLVRTFPFTPADISAARLDGGHLIVARSYTIESYNVASGALEVSQPLPPGYQLADVDDGIAVFRRAQAIIVLRLDNGVSITLAPGQPPMFADLETPGLYYSYATGDGGGRVVFLSRSELLQQLGGGR